jgi:hypothetical protein
MQLPGHLKEAVGKTCLMIERGGQFPWSVANIVLFRSQTDLFKRHNVSKAVVSPGTCQLTRNPGMHWLRDGDLS